MSAVFARPSSRPGGGALALSPVTPLMLLCLTTVPSDAGTRSAQMSVSVNVIRSCRISAPDAIPAPARAGESRASNTAISQCSGAGEVVPMRSAALVSRTEPITSASTSQAAWTTDTSFNAPQRVLSMRGNPEPSMIEVRVDY